MWNQSSDKKNPNAKDANKIETIVKEQEPLIQTPIESEGHPANSVLIDISDKRFESKNRKIFNEDLMSTKGDTGVSGSVCSFE